MRGARRQGALRQGPAGRDHRLHRHRRSLRGARQPRGSPRRPSGVPGRVGPEDPRGPVSELVLPDLAAASAEDVIRWAVAEFAPDVVATASMADAGMVDLL